MKLHISLMCLIFLLGTSLSAIPFRASPEGNNIYLVSENNIPERARTILTNVIQNKQKVTDVTYELFWNELSHYEPLTEERRSIIRDRLVGQSLMLPSLFYKDALISLYLGYPYKSEHRKAYEQRLINLRAITIADQNAQTKMLQKMLMLDQKATSSPTEPKETRAGLQKLVTRFDNTEDRVNALFKLPKISEKRVTSVPVESQFPSENLTEPEIDRFDEMPDPNEHPLKRRLPDESEYLVPPRNLSEV
jgi:hypothetical protein